MALFARKSKSSSDDVSALPLPTAPNAQGGASATVQTEDADNGSAPNRVAPRFKRGSKAGRAPNASKVSREPKGIKGGAVVGLNIGNDSIKAVEVRSRSGEIVVTAAGMIPTPAESLSNGIVMSPAALSSAIRELFAQSGIRTKSAITSIMGGGALVVRVLEVPKMSDAELAENMNMDLERYVPFPPAEVVKDFRALRELPSDPDAPNMEVLLAAAQNETIDLHLKVLQGAKLDPQAIDVEPLAAARAIFYGTGVGGADSGAGLTQDVATDYNDATALINIGATNTEISVLRGDVLVFTRSVPVAGNALTQALADHLGLTWPDAERMKRDMGDALPPHEADPQAAANASTEDWSAFGDDEMAQNASVQSGSDGADDDVAPAEQTAVASVDESAPVSSDPFDTDMFNNGPRQDEPQEGHRQKQDDATGNSAPGGNPPGGAPPVGTPPFNFDLSRFSFTEDERVVDNDIPTDTPEAESEAAPIVDVTSSTESAENALDSAPNLAQNESVPLANNDETPQNLPALSFPMAGEDEELTTIAPSGQMYGVGSSDDPELPSFPTLPSIAAGAPTQPFSSNLQMPAGLLAPGSENYNDESEDSLPTISDEEALLTADEDDLSSLPTIVSSPISVETPVITPGASTVSGVPVFDFSAPAVSETLLAPAMGDDDFESAFASMIAAPATAQPAAPNLAIETPSEVAPGVAPGAAEPILTPGSMTSPYAVAPSEAANATESDFDLDQFATGSTVDNSFGLEDFGLGLGGDEGATPKSVHAILQPRLAEMVNEVRRSLEYYASRYPDAGVRRIVLVGGGAKLSNLDAMMTQEIGIPTTVQNPLGRVNLEAKGLPADFVDQNGAAFAVALGLALRDVVR